MGVRIHPKVKEFLSAAGKKGGSSKAERKVMASRENGKLGGRPRKVKKDNEENDTSAAKK